MTISGLTRTLVAVAATTALTVTAAPGHALGDPDGPDFGAPTVGACSTMTSQQSDAQADKSTVVPCSQAHTAKVAGVVQLPAALDYSSAPTSCTRRWSTGASRTGTPCSAGRTRSATPRRTSSCGSSPTRTSDSTAPGG